MKSTKEFPSSEHYGRCGLVRVAAAAKALATSASHLSAPITAGIPDKDTETALLKPQSAWLVSRLYGSRARLGDLLQLTDLPIVPPLWQPSPPFRSRPAGMLPPLPPAEGTALYRLPHVVFLLDAVRWMTIRSPVAVDALPQDGGRPAAAGSAAAGPWRSAAPRSDAPSKLPPSTSRFDTSIGGRSWREEEREPVARRDSGRWGDGGGEAGGAAARAYAEPQNPAWNDAPRPGRGRGAGEVDSWKPRAAGAGAGSEWRSSTGDSNAGGGSWRSNDRWGAGTGVAGAVLLHLFGF